MCPGPAKSADFLLDSNFDLWYFCSLLTYKDVQYLIWKIWFISVWSLKSKAVVWLLTGFMFDQSTLILHHTEANGCIFFAAGVCIWQTIKLGFWHLIKNIVFFYLSKSYTGENLFLELLNMHTDKMILHLFLINCYAQISFSSALLVTPRHGWQRQRGRWIMRST